jgi:hypothetical protein
MIDFRTRCVPEPIKPLAFPVLLLSNQPCTFCHFCLLRGDRSYQFTPQSMFYKLLAELGDTGNTLSPICFAIVQNSLLCPPPRLR